MYVLGAVAALGVLIALAGGLAINAGYGSDRINAAADSQLSALFERKVDARFSHPHISFAGIGRLAVAVSDASLVGEDGREMGRADDLRFIFSIPALLKGQVMLTGARANHARIDLMALGLNASDANSDPAAMLADPDRINAVLFSSAAGLVKGLERAGATRIGLSDVDLVWAGEGQEKLHVVDFELRRKDRALTVTGSMTRSEGSYGVDGSAELGADDAVSALDVALDLPERKSAGGQAALSAARVHLSGSQVGGERLSVTLEPFDISLVDKDVGLIVARVAASADITSGSGGIGFREITAEFGRSRLVFHGAAMAKTDESGSRSYRYELVSDASTLAPNDSPEATLPIIARLKGAWAPATGTFSADEISVRTPGGEVRGTASMTFTGAGSPATFLAITVSGMPVAHAKQLWPSPAAPSARRWVLSNLFGGQVTAGSLELKAGLGRLAAGTLTSDEISGQFRVEGARFDIAGDLPPMRDAVGEIRFAGSDVHITLDSGTAFLPTGKSVSASNGTLEILSAHVSPVVGKLNIDVAGTADAVAELSSYRPINALKHLPFEPGDLTGDVTGSVAADIPLSTTGADYEPVFRVALDYRNVAIAQPFGGQKVTDADGSVVVDPQKAVISATAKLNGLPARIEMVEPLEQGNTKREQKITFVIDEKTQKAIAPGLSSLIGGPFTLEMSPDGTRRQRGRADLTKASVDLPWVGWSKGAGIPAEATFAMETAADGSTQVSDFKLSGKSFAMAGNLALKGDSLVSADFSQFKLNAADKDVSLTVKRSGKGYDVRLSASSFDGRSLVREVLSDPVQAGSNIGSTPVTLSAKIDSALGFNDERLQNVQVNYSGTGQMIGKMAITASTDGGGDVSMTNESVGDGRKVRMESSDAGALLRFLDIYERMRGGAITLALAGGVTGALQGEIDARDFQVVNEPRLKSLVSSRPEAEKPSLSEAVKQDIDTSVVKFERGYAQIVKGRGLLKLDKGILRGPLIGFSFQGTFYDPDNRMAMTGTMMPAYGLNRIFAEIPLVGVILGNGRDKGLLGITFKLSGKASDPTLAVNPISLIAPGIFRAIFEFKKG